MKSTLNSRIQTNLALAWKAAKSKKIKDKIFMQIYNMNLGFMHFAAKTCRYHSPEDIKELKQLFAIYMHRALCDFDDRKSFFSYYTFWVRNAIDHYEQKCQLVGSRIIDRKRAYPTFASLNRTWDSCSKDGKEDLMYRIESVAGPGIEYSVDHVKNANGSLTPQQKRALRIWAFSKQHNIDATWVYAQKGYNVASMKTATDRGLKRLRARLNKQKIKYVG